MELKLEDVVDALEAAGDEHSHYLDKRTGEIILLTNEDFEAAEEDELISDYPAWQRESILKAREVLGSSQEHFLALPDQFEIHEYQLMEEFGHEFEDRMIGERLLQLIKGPGAFRRFKNEISSLGMEKSWFDFKGKKFEKIAIEWLEEHNIQYSRGDGGDVTEVNLEV